MVKFAGKQVASVVTAFISLDQGQAMRYQFIMDIPTVLFPTPQNRTALLKRYTAFEEEARKIHREYRRQFIESCLSSVFNDCTL